MAAKQSLRDAMQEARSAVWSFHSNDERRCSAPAKALPGSVSTHWPGLLCCAPCKCATPSYTSVMTVMFAMPIVAVTIIVSVWAMILSFVTINIEQQVPTHIKVIAIMAVPVPTMKIIMSPQPVRITVTVPDNVVPIVTPVLTSVC